ncbi:hypothetical protein B6U99_05765 [Candidatus Geothermarchaeota archaeon ex4572_27]|nr:MAG: hypothetical protein B6U99_05765 [Candidatus Geothermarchaeota archaeon ex4572_27]
MGLSSADRIVEKIVGDARREADRIVGEARAYAERVVEEARRRARERIDSELSKYRASREEEARRALMEARVKARERWLKEREDLISQAIERVRERLARVVEEPGYVKALEQLIEEAAVSIGGGDLVVQLNERDAKLPLDLEGVARRVKERTGVDTKIELSDRRVECMGGAIVMSRDGSFVYDNTLESRLARREAEMRLAAAKILFA